MITQNALIQSIPLENLEWHAHYTLKNIKYTIYFLEMIRNLYLYSPEAIQAATDSHVLVTLCSAYGYAEKADKCDQLCESTIQDKTLDNIRVSGRNFRQFGLMFMYYCKHNMIEKTKRARNITE